MDPASGGRGRRIIECKMTYAIDTNVYIDWWCRRYPDDIFPTIRVKVEGLIKAGKWRSVQGAADEIRFHGDPGLASWAKAVSVQFQPHDADIMREANNVIRLYPGLVDQYAHHDEADRYLIAYAKLSGSAVVTHETPAIGKKMAARTHYIPDVCAGLGIPCITLVDVMRQENWLFT